MALLTLKFVTDVRDLNYEIVEFHGELDQSTLADTEKQILSLLEKFDRPFLVFDFSNLNFINSEGIGFIFSVNMKLRKKGKKLALCGMKENVADVINLMGLPKVIDVFSAINDVLKQFK